MITESLIAGGGLFFLYGIYSYIFDWIQWKLPPGPMPMPFIGNIGVLAVDPVKTKAWTVFRNLSRKYGPITTIYVGQFRMICLQTSEVIHEALVSQGKTFAGRNDTNLPGFETVPVGIIMESGQNWQRRRRFGLKAMRDFGMGKEAMAHKIQDELCHLIDELAKLHGKPFQPRPLMNNTVSNVVCSLCFGKRFEFNNEEFHHLMECVDQLLTVNQAKGAPFLILPFLKHFLLPPQVRKFVNLRTHIGKIAMTAVNEHRPDFDPENIRDFPDLFISLETDEEGVAAEEYIDIMTDMFIAGTDTTSTALTWTLLYLCHYPEVQARCHEEIDRAIGSDRLPTIADRPNLTYIDALMCEILRHATVVPHALNHSNREVGTKINGYDIPPWSMIMYNVTAMHHDPGYWKDPEQFNPDRWLDPTTGKLLNHSSHFMPFGVGLRICLGESLAKMEYFLFLVAILHRYTVKLHTKGVTINDGIQGFIHTPPKFEIVTESRF